MTCAHRFPDGTICGHEQDAHSPEVLALSGGKGHVPAWCWHCIAGKIDRTLDHEYQEAVTP